MSGAIENVRTGQRMVFVTERPELLEIETVNPRSSVREPQHVHPLQEIRPTRPPWPVQQALAALLAPIARRRGYHGDYRGSTVT